MGIDGLKRVRNRRDDALSRTSWDRLESLLAEYYAKQGYRVEHVGTGRTGRGSDGGIDLKLFKDDQYIVVQCKGWNACQVPHNDVHELIGVMMTEHATGAIFVTTGEYTYAALKKAREVASLTLVDGDGLREMLGPLPEPEAHACRGMDDRQDARPWGLDGLAREAITSAGGRLLKAAEDRIRHGGGVRRHGIGVVDTMIWAKVVGLAISFALMLLAVYIAIVLIKSGGTQVTRSAPGSAVAGQPVQPHEHRRTTHRGQTATRAAAPVSVPRYRMPTQEEIRESQRKADEAIRVLEETTPEM